MNVPMTEQEFNTIYKNWQNPLSVSDFTHSTPVPEGPRVPVGNMMPPVGRPSGFRSLNPRQPMAFNLPPAEIPLNVGGYNLSAHPGSFIRPQDMPIPGQPASTPPMMPPAPQNQTPPTPQQQVAPAPKYAIPKIPVESLPPQVRAALPPVPIDPEVSISGEKMVGPPLTQEQLESRRAAGKANRRGTEARIAARQAAADAVNASAAGGGAPNPSPPNAPPAPKSALPTPADVVTNGFGRVDAPPPEPISLEGQPTKPQTINPKDGVVNGVGMVDEPAAWRGYSGPLNDPIKLKTPTFVERNIEAMKKAAKNADDSYLRKYGSVADKLSSAMNSPQARLLAKAGYVLPGITGAIDVATMSPERRKEVGDNTAEQLLNTVQSHALMGGIKPEEINAVGNSTFPKLYESFKNSYGDKTYENEGDWINKGAKNLLTNFFTPVGRAVEGAADVMNALTFDTARKGGKALGVKLYDLFGDKTDHTAPVVVQQSIRDKNTQAATGTATPKNTVPDRQSAPVAPAAAIPIPPSANPYALNSAALPEVTGSGEQTAVSPVMDTKFSPNEMLQQGSFGMYPKGAGPTPEDNFTKHATISMLGSPSEQQQQQVGDLVKQGYKEVNNLQSAPGDYAGTPFYRKTTDITAEQLHKTDPARYKALMELQALREADAAGQAKQYQQTGLTPPPIVTKDKYGAPVTTIMQTNAPVIGKSLDPNAPKPFDMNNMEEYRAEIPGKGWVTGIRQKDPNRQQGTLSITPGLSDSERAQVAQIDADRARQNAYAISRSSGEKYDAALQNKQQQEVLYALKRMQEQGEQGRWQAEQSSAAQRHKDTMDEKAARLSLDMNNREIDYENKALQSQIEQENNIQKSFQKYNSESGKGWADFQKDFYGYDPYNPETNKTVTPYKAFAHPTVGMVNVMMPNGTVKPVSKAAYDRFMLSLGRQ